MASSFDELLQSAKMTRLPKERKQLLDQARELAHTQWYDAEPPPSCPDPVADIRRHLIYHSRYLRTLELEEACVPQFVITKPIYQLLKQVRQLYQSGRAAVKPPLPPQVIRTIQDERLVFGPAHQFLDQMLTWCDQVESARSSDGETQPSDVDGPAPPGILTVTPSSPRELYNWCEECQKILFETLDLAQIDLSPGDKLPPFVDPFGPNAVLKLLGHLSRLGEHGFLSDIDPHDYVDARKAIQLLETVKQRLDPTTVPMLQQVGDVPDVGRVSSIADFCEWCARWREEMRQLRIRLGERTQTAVAGVEFRVIPEIVWQCRNYLLGFGVQDIPDRFSFASLPREQSPAGVEHFPAPMEGFVVWASQYGCPGHELMRLVGEVEDFLTWAMGRYQTDLEKNASCTEPEEAPQHVAQDANDNQKKVLPEPSPDAVAAYRAQLLTGKKQRELANLLTEELGRPIHQGTVSRWLKQVRTWLKAGNVLPDLNQPPPKKPKAMDPRQLDAGARRDGRASRQRGRRDTSSDD